ncbi:MAG: cobalt ECF transporter T component CbiQ [Euryarchaeota archaeon]|nr:cobalt ECF transporter T component CbiQ [Euryarchaeota archaeon]
MELFDIEREALKDSPVHRLDGRVKIVSFLLVVLIAVFIGRSGQGGFAQRMEALALLEAFILAVLVAGGLSPSLFVKRVLLILPFGGAIALLKPFIEGGTPLYVLPLGLTVSLEGVREGALILSVMVVSVSSMVVLSSTTTVQELVNSSRRMGLPRELALLFAMALRYLFHYYEVFKRIADAQRTRCFSIRNRRVGPRFILEQLGYTAAMIFVMSYLQGTRVYESMLARGYNPDSAVPSRGRGIALRDAAFISLTLAVAGFALLI